MGGAHNVNTSHDGSGRTIRLSVPAGRKDGQPAASAAVSSAAAGSVAGTPDGVCEVVIDFDKRKVSCPSNAALEERVRQGLREVEGALLPLPPGGHVGLV
eukprot:GDKI01042481.1.p1 GENE.GDKI01042481.1~~GDKI01042481.1.p1  ORF type:complete len:100 (-),score=24.31 GDKI01042481.1:115-414(-)